MEDRKREYIGNAERSSKNRMRGWRILLGVLLFGACFFLFYKQAYSDGTVYGSDLPDHIAFAREGSSYSALYYLMGALLKIVPHDWIAAALEALLVVLTWCAARRFVMKYSDLPEPVCTGVSFAVLFLCSLYVPVLSPWFYRLGYVTQPWHNITYIGMRLFAVMTMYCFVDTFRHYQERIDRKNWILISAFLAASTAVKPNFLMCFSMALLVFLLKDFAEETARQGFRIQNLKKYVIMGCVVLPSLLILGLQGIILYGGADNTSGISFGMQASSFMPGKRAVLVGLLKALPFPALVCFYNRGKSDKARHFFCMMYLFAFLTGMLFQETGERAIAGNFMWGMYVAGYLMFLFLIPEYLSTVMGWRDREKTAAQKLYAVCGSVLLFWHFSSGLAYFIRLLMGYKKW